MTITSVEVYENGYIAVDDCGLPYGEDRRTHACPACGQPSIYTWALDRFVHIDGTDNRDCWYRLIRREAVTPVVTRTVPAGHIIAADYLPRR